VLLSRDGGGGRPESGGVAVRNRVGLRDTQDLEGWYQEILPASDWMKLEDII